MGSGGGCFEEASGVGVSSPVGSSGKLPWGNGVLSRAAWLPNLLGSGSGCVSGARRKVTLLFRAQHCQSCCRSRPGLMPLLGPRFLPCFWEP